LVQNFDNNVYDIEGYLNAPCQLSAPVRAINLLNPHKAPGHDPIVATILKNLPRKAILLITYIYIYIYIYQRNTPFPLSCPVEAHTNRHDIQTEKTHNRNGVEGRPLSRIEKAVPLDKLIPPYQFAFRENRSTAQQCYRIILKIRDSLEVKNMCFRFSLMYRKPSTVSGMKVYYTS
jgi:hypothetical protein